MWYWYERVEVVSVQVHLRQMMIIHQQLECSTSDSDSDNCDSDNCDHDSDSGDNCNDDDSESVRNQL